MRILIVGAGLSGLTLAALLKQRGILADIVDNSINTGNNNSYMTGISPLGSNVFHGLGCYEDFLKNTERLRVYQLYDNNANFVREFVFSEFNNKYGRYQCTTNHNLLNILQNSGNKLPVNTNNTISSIMQTPNVALVKFTDGSSSEYDLVVGCDGANSVVRDLILNKNEIETFNTNWSCFIWWGNKNSVPTASACEFWGDKFFLGAYPTEQKLGVTLACNNKLAKQAMSIVDRRDFFTHLTYNVVSKHPELFANFPKDDEDIAFWPLIDVRCNKWSKGRVVLLGDAATAFLPISGIGASMAIESAAILNDVLSRTDAKHIELALKLYESRRKLRVERAQDESRRLSKIMFLDSTVKSTSRDIFMKLFKSRMTPNQFMKHIIEALDSPA